MNLKLRNARKKALLNQYQLAKRCGISQAYYSGIERGDITPKTKYKTKIAAVLGLLMHEIFSEEIDEQTRY